MQWRWYCAVVLGVLITASQWLVPASGQDKKPAQALDAKLAIPASDEGLPGAGPIRRADWFQNVWLNRRSQFAREANQQQHAVVFLGDSITQGWGERLEKYFPKVKIANRGISGDTTRGREEAAPGTQHFARSEAAPGTQHFAGGVWWSADR